jgi:hypothetical protein
MATIETRTTPDGKTSSRVKIRIRGFPSQSATFERKRDATPHHETSRAVTQRHAFRF